MCATRLGLGLLLLLLNNVPTMPLRRFSLVTLLFFFFFFFMRVCVGGVVPVKATSHSRFLKMR